MKVVSVHLESISAYSQSKYYETPHLERENPKDYEARTWRDRLHVDEKGEVYIPPMAFKNVLSEIAKFLGMQIPGKGKSTYTKHFEAGLLVMDRYVLESRQTRSRESGNSFPPMEFGVLANASSNASR